MNKKLKVYVVGDAEYYAKWIENHIIVNHLEDADVVFFTGGEDVTPAYYNCEKLPCSFCNAHRDAVESRIFNSINPKNQIALGVCRGSQFLCAMNGGVLVQDCNNHAIFGTHEIETIDGKTFDITSTHHQMQDPYGLPKEHYTVIAWANGLSTKYEGFKLHKEELSKKEPEIVLYSVPEKPRCLAIQGHPEMLKFDAPILGELNNLLINIINI